MPSPSHVSLSRALCPLEHAGGRAPLLITSCRVSLLPLTSPGPLVRSFSHTACLHCLHLGRVLRSRPPPQMHVAKDS